MVRHLLCIAGAFALAGHCWGHSREMGPLPAEILSHQDNVEYLARCGGFKTPGGAMGLHFFYVLEPQAQQLVLKLLMSDDPNAQAIASGIVAHDGAPSDPTVRESMFERLPQLTTSKDRRVRHNAAEAIGRAHVIAGASSLMNLLHDKDLNVRAAAIHSLHRLKVNQAKPIIRKMRKTEKSRYVRSLIDSFLRDDPTEAPIEDR